MSGPSRQIHWYSAGLGIAASAMCGAFLLANPPGFSAGASGKQTGFEAVKVLNSVSGTTYAAAASPTNDIELAGPATVEAFQPVAWNAIAAPGCMTLTLDNGEKLSFRIHGYRLAGERRETEPGETYDLAVRACSQTGNAVVRAVIEPEAADRAPKPAVPEQSL